MTLTDTTFEKILNTFNLDENKNWAVAVSGGADSLCLTLLLHEFCKQRNISLTALTVNHNIRKESLKEAKSVHDFLKKNGIKHQILENKIPIGTTSVEEEARNIRYNLLTSFCKEKNIPYLFVAHQLEDQIETFLSRLSRGSGLDGLCAIKKHLLRDGIKIIRPFLNISKTEIKKYLQKKGIDWVEDPMNQDEQYERVKWRKFLPVLEKNNLSCKALSLSINRLNRVQKALQQCTQNFISSNVKFFNEGYALIEKDSFFNLEEEIKIRVLHDVLKTIGQSEKIISLELLERAVLELPKKMSLANCLITTHKKGLFISKEQIRMEKEKRILKNTPTKWDRFIITPTVSGTIKAKAPEKRKKNIPYAVQQSFPFFKAEKELENLSNIEYKESSQNNVEIQFIHNI